MTTLHTAGGQHKLIPEEWADDLDRLHGLDREGRIVVDNYDASGRPHDHEFLFGLTLCCNASDKGTEHGVVCRGCYSPGEVGNYLFATEDGHFPGLDPVIHIDL